MDFLQTARVASVLRGQDLPRHELVEGFEAVGMDMDTVADFLLEERFHPVDDGVNEWGNVDDVDFFQFHRIGFLK